MENMWTINKTKSDKYYLYLTHNGICYWECIVKSDGCFNCGVWDSPPRDDIRVSGGWLGEEMIHLCDLDDTVKLLIDIRSIAAQYFLSQKNYDADWR